MARILVLMGSASDQPIVQGCLDVLAELGIDHKAAVSSAHRSPERTRRLIAEAEAGGAQVVICAAGMAAHLAGAAAAQTALPVIGIPILGSALGGMDALFSTVQMPPGFPVATVALNGAKNAAWLAAQILALSDAGLKARILEARRGMAEALERKDP